jgi:hypothetical protein
MYDGAEPAGNSVAAHNLLRLARLRARDDWQTMAWRLIGSFAEIIEHYPPALPLMLSAWQQRERELLQVVIAGKRGAADTEALLLTAEYRYDPHRLVLLADGGENQKYLAEKLPFLDSIGQVVNRATAYVCADFSCKRPTHDPEELMQQMADAQGGAST